MAARFADLPEALANCVAIAQRCNLTIPLGKNYLPDFPDARRRRPSTSTCATRRRPGSSGGSPRCIRMPPTRDAKRADYVARLDFETTTIVQMGFAGYFLIVADFINWAKSNGVPVGPGRGSGAGSLVAYALGITDLDPLRYAPAVRALPQSRARVDAGLRHRLLPGRPRPRHRLRQEEVRRRLGVADRDLRHDGGEGGGARRRPRARPAVHLLRRHRQADPVPARASWSRCARRATMEPLLAEREQKEEEVRELLALAEALEGLTAQRRHARRRRADRAGQAHRFLPAVHAAGRRRDRVAVRQGRRRGGRARQVRLPRPHDADDPRLDAALREAPRPGERRSTLETLPLDDKADLRHLPDGQHGRGVPVRIARHARPAQQAPPTRFEDIIALVALYRPGPMELIPDVHRRARRDASASSISIRGSSRSSARPTA